MTDENKKPKFVLIECMFPHCRFHLRVQFDKKTGKPVRSQKEVEDDMKDHIERKHYQEYWQFGTEQLIAENICAQRNKRVLVSETSDVKSKNSEPASSHPVVSPVA
jgi:hypothetical protein